MNWNTQVRIALTKSELTLIYVVLQLPHTITLAIICTIVINAGIIIMSLHGCDCLFLSLCLSSI